MSPLKKITWVLAASSLIALALLLPYLTHSLRLSAIQQWQDNKTLSAKQLAGWIDKKFAQAQERLEYIAGLAEFTASPNPDLIDRSLNGIPEGADVARRQRLDWLLQESDRGFSVLFVLLPNGDHYLSHPFAVQQSLKTYNLSHRPYFQRVKATRQAAVSDTFIGADDEPAVAIDQPILNARGEISSHLGGVFHLSGLDRLLASAIAGKNDEALFLLDRPGNLIARSGKASAQIQTFITLPEVTNFLSGSAATSADAPARSDSEVIHLIHDGERWVMLLVRLANGWTLGISADLATVTARFDPGIQRTAILAATLLLSISVIGILLSHRIGRRWQSAEGQLEQAKIQLEQRVAERTRELKESQVKLQSILDYSPTLISTKDLEGNLTLANRRFNVLAGPEPGAFVGKNIYDLFPKEVADELWHNDLAARNGPVEVEEVVAHKDGSMHTYLTNKFPLTDHHGTLFGTCAISIDITDRKQAEAEAVEQQKQTRDLLESTAEAIYGLDMDGYCTFANAACAQLLGYPHPDQLIGHNMHQLIHHSHADGHTYPIEQCPIYTAFQSGREVNVDSEVLWRADGSCFPAEYWSHPVRRDGQLVGAVVTFLDITERKRSQEELRLAASVFTHAREGIIITDADGTILDVNATFTRITGYTRDEVLGQKPSILKSGRQNADFYRAMWRALLRDGHWYGEIWNRHKEGHIYVEMLTISAVCDAQNRAQHFVALFSDITALKEHERRLEYIAHYDALTALPNRVLLADRLHQAMALAQRHKQMLAVVYLDLDGFKTINDNYGHEVGDRLLIALSRRMKLDLREGDAIARLGGDEFVAVLSDLTSAEDSIPFVHRLLAAVSEPIRLGERALQVSGSLGISLFPQAEEVDADQLLRQADQAMYQAKLAGKNRYHFFDADHDRELKGQHELIEEIRRGLPQDQFELYYQPKINMRSGEIIGVEALLRWQHPAHGLLTPPRFLHVIENHYLGIELGEWVIDAALSQLEAWYTQGLTIQVSVNVGGRQLLQNDFIRRLEKLLAGHPAVRPGSLQLEVIETSALEDMARASEVMRICRDIGVTFALDDFGTGYSSLAHLKHLPAVQLKIDRSFVRDMLEDPDDLAIIEGILGLATAFRRQVIAEGVESIEHRDLLLLLGCEFGQGYGFAHPMPAQDLPPWAAAWNPPPTAARLAPVESKDTPALYAASEHRAWIKAVSDSLRRRSNCAPPPMDPTKCRFGNWLGKEARRHYGDRLAYQRINSLHAQVHALGSELVALQADNQGEKARTRLDELYLLSDSLIAQLQHLITPEDSASNR